MRKDFAPSIQASRNRAAEQIVQYRTLADRNPRHTPIHDRQGAYYVQGLYGLERVFDYVRSQHIPQIVIDVGAGTTRGIADIASSYLGRGLSFFATVLSMRPEIEHNLGRERVRITSAEVMRGFMPESVGCILGVLSFDYTKAPEIVAKRFNEILAPGGVIKASLFNNSQLPQALMALGFDVSVSNIEETDYTDTFMVAIKPGGDSSVAAIDLLREDEETHEDQILRVLQKK